LLKFKFCFVKKKLLNNTVRDKDFGRNDEAYRV